MSDHDGHPAVIIDGATGHRLGPSELEPLIGAAMNHFDTAPNGTVFLAARRDPETIATYLACWRMARPVAMLDPGIPPEALTALVTRYRPAVVVAPSTAGPLDGYRCTSHGSVTGWQASTVEPAPVHPDLALLLATSGSTGNPRMVRLSRKAVRHNAEAIGTALAIGPDEIAPTCLPLHYSFGLSVVNSHLVRGATVLVTSADLSTKAFWDAVRTHGATSLSGVPRGFRILEQMRWQPTKSPSLRTLNQAGGRLPVDMIDRFGTMIGAVGGRLHVMWGQTEACPRMTTLPASRVADKAGSVGPALPGGSLSIRLADGTETCSCGVEGEVVYRGPNVMLGYAESAADLALGDTMAGVLRTGDLGRLDEDGYLWLTGRASRIAKVFGVRVSLDDVEALVGAPGVAAALSEDDRVVVFHAGIRRQSERTLGRELADRLRVHHSGVVARSVDGLPLLPSGKVDYRRLRELL